MNQVNMLCQRRNTRSYYLSFRYIYKPGQKVFKIRHVRKRDRFHQWEEEFAYIVSICARSTDFQRGNSKTAMIDNIHFLFFFTHAHFVAFNTQQLNFLWQPKPDLNNLHLLKENKKKRDTEIKKKHEILFLIIDQNTWSSSVVSSESTSDTKLKCGR